MVEGFLGEASTPTAQASEVFISSYPDPIRDSGIQPLHVSTYQGFEKGREEFIRGAQALGFATPRKPLHPQQYVIADVLNACDSDGNPIHTVTGICVPRRASKTTSILILAFGRCLSRDDYNVAFTAQTGSKARTRFLEDMVKPLERMFPDEDTRPFKINRSRGGEFIRFDNGSILAILPPLADSFRGDAWDLVITDEAQVYSPELSEDLQGAILPTFDTRPGAQLVVAGTVGAARAGLLWDTLQKGRKGRAGIVEYAAPEFTREPDEPDPEDEAETDYITGTTADPEVWKRAHPGIGNLTPFKTMESRYEDLPRAQFIAEYLGIWPMSTGSKFIDPDKWKKCASAAGFAPKPKQFSLAFSTHPEAKHTSIVAAWRDEKGYACVEVLDSRDGIKWVAPRLKELALKHKVPIIYDSISAAANVEIESLKRSNPKPRLAPQTWANVSTAASLITKEIDTMRLRHYDQPALNLAVQNTTKRGTKASTRWAFGRIEFGADITALEAASLALRHFDSTPQQARMPRVTLS